MKFLFLAFALSVLVGAACADVTIIRDGKAQSAIYVAPDIMAADKPYGDSTPHAETQLERDRRKLRESVRDLSLYLEKMSGAKIEVLTAAPAPGTKRSRILVGEYAVKAFGPPTKKAPFKQGWRIVVSAKGIGLMGESHESATYAIFEVLDRLGCRWFMPGAMGEAIPSLKTIALKETDTSQIPATTARDIWYADPGFERRNRMSGIQIIAGHSLENFITDEERAAHPEWRALVKGKRHAGKRLCWGNPEVAPALAENIIKKLDTNYQPYLSLGPLDGMGFCECPLDLALDAGDLDPSINQISITDRYIHFCNAIASRVVKKHPDVLLGTAAYSNYTRPPVREKLHPNMIPMIAPITYCRAHAMTDTHICPTRPQLRPIVEGWGKAARQLSYYNYMYHLAEITTPYPMIHQMKAELPIIYANNMTYWQPETFPNFESALPGLWLSIRKAWSPQTDSDAILNELYTRFYGSAGAAMKKYWTHWDDAWTKSPEHAGSAFGYVARFKPEILKEARTLMNAALASASTLLQYRRVKMHDEALRQFDLFMQMRWDLNEGRLRNLGRDSMRWLGTQISLGEEYDENDAFAKVDWTPYTGGGHYFRDMLEATYQDAARIAENYTIISKPLRNWRYSVDREKKGEGLGWHHPGFYDAAWKTTDPAVETWFALGLHDYYGPVWYRDSVTIPAVPEGKKVFLWISSTDGSAKVFVNGRHIPYVDAKGEKSDTVSAYARPFSFDITSAIKPGAANQITIIGTHEFLNELGTGGLLGPGYLYREK